MPERAILINFLIPDWTEAVWKPPAPDAELFAKMHGGEEWLIGA